MDTKENIEDKNITVGAYADYMKKNIKNWTIKFGVYAIIEQPLNF